MTKSNQSILFQHVKNKFPNACGVYLFFGPAGKVIYVGKSVNIRNRVLDHLRQKQEESSKRKGVLSAGTGFIRYIVTNDELVALLIEDKLIKQYMPSYNILQKSFQKYKYLGITGGLYPGIKVFRHSFQVKKRLVFGPFRSKLHIDILITIIQRYFKMRICLDASPVLKCVYHDIELCKGPCTGEILPLSYTATVNDVIQFLNGNVQSVLQALHKDLNSRTSCLDFENAHKIQKMIEFCNVYKQKQVYYNSFKYNILEILSKVSGEVKYSFIKGRMNSFADETNTLLAESGILESEHYAFSDPRILLDRSDILFSWRHKHADEYEFRFR